MSQDPSSLSADGEILVIDHTPAKERDRSSRPSSRTSSHKVFAKLEIIRVLC